MSELGYYGYLIAAAGYFVLLLLLLTNWRGRLLGGILLLACALTVVWGVVLGMHAYGVALPSSLFWGMETLRSFVWLAFLARLLNPSGVLREGFPKVLAIVVSLFTIVLLLPINLDQLLRQLAPSIAGNISVRYFGYVILALSGLILIEQLYRNTQEDNRWGIKYLLLGLGAMFAFDFYLYADALLFQRIDTGLWYARGPIVTMAVPLIGLSVARNPTWSIHVFVSRRMVFHTTAIFSAGIYMLLMAVAGYYIRLYGGEWGSVFQVIFFSGAALILIVLTSSGQVRAHVKVFLNKHFFKSRYDYREEWLRLIATLSGQESNVDLFQRAIGALASIVDSPGGYLFLTRTAGRAELIERYNAPEVDLPTDIDYLPLTTLLTEKEWVVLFDEEHAEGRNAVPPPLLGIDKAWLITPLLHDQQLTGFVLLLAPKAPMQLNWENMDLLKTSGRQAASYLSLYQAAEALAEARQFEGFNRLSAFVIHDLKNIIAQLSLVTKNAVKHKSNPAFVDDAMTTIENAVERMSRLLTQLNSSRVEDEPSCTDLVQAVQESVLTQSQHQPVPVLSSAEGPIPVQAEADRLVSVISHVIQNAQDATPDDGEIRIVVEPNTKEALVHIIDTGSGMSEQFIREHLFKPFHTTKGLTGMGIGAYECREFVRSIGGHVEVRSEPGKGSTFSLSIPVAFDCDRKAAESEGQA